MAGAAHTPWIEQQKHQRRGRRILIGLIALVVLGVAVAGVVLGLRKSPTAPVFQSKFAKTIGSNETTDLGNLSNGSQSVVVAFDGWSAHILPSKTLQAQVVQGDKAVGSTVTFTLQPATVAQIEGLLGDAPNLVASLFGRLVSVDPTTTCTSDSCSASGKPLSLTELIHPSTIPGYGTEYAGYGITSGLYVAKLKVPASVTSIKISESGWGSYQLEVTNPAAVAKIPAKEKAYAPTPLPADGYLVDDYLLSAGLGQIFLDQPAWIGKGAGYADLDLPPLAQSGTPTSTQKALTAGAFSEGLGVPVAAADSLGPSLLTWMTSAVTGCGPGVACVPGKADVKVTQGTHTVIQVCTTGSSFSMPAVMSDSTWQITYKVPTAQFGIWDGKSTSQFTGAGSYKAASGLWSGTQPLVTGSQKERQSVIFVFTGNPTTLTVVGGQAAQYGDTSTADLTTPFNASFASQVGPYTSC